MSERSVSAALLLLLGTIGAVSLHNSIAHARTADPAVEPVLVELFTSEGCSSCPPADALLSTLAAKHGGAPVVTLSEHVDYWNHDGWRDPFSSAAISQRQSAYGDRFGLGSVYTPQMIVDGQYQFVGSDRSAAARAIATAAEKEKVHLRIEDAAWAGDTLTATIKTGAIPASLKGARLFVALADASDTSHVESGENGGRTLTHVSVLRVLQQVGALGDGTPQESGQRVKIRLPGHSEHTKLQLIVFAQQPDFGPVVGASVLSL